MLQPLIPDDVYERIQHNRLREHFDAADTAFLERELVQLRPKIIDLEYADLIARSLMPMATDIAQSAEVFAFKTMKPVGMAKVINAKSHDLPRVDVVATEIQGKVYQLGASYGWSINELREAARLRVPLSEYKAKAARDAIELAIDELLGLGNLTATSGQTGMTMLGLTNNTDVVNLGLGTMHYWVDGNDTASVMLADLQALLDAPANGTKGKFQANRLLLPTAKYNYAKGTPFSTLTGKSVLATFLENNPGVEVKPWWKLTTAGAGNVPRAIAYKVDSTVLEGVLPQEFEQMPPEVRGLEFIVNCTARCGGVKIYQPTAFKYADFEAS